MQNSVVLMILQESHIKNVAESEYWELYTSWTDIVMLQNYLDCRISHLDF